MVESVAKDRKSGRLNDDYSLAVNAGFRVIANNYGVAAGQGDSIQDICDHAGEGFANSLVALEDMEDCFNFYLPKGYYGMRFGSAELREEGAEQNPDQAMWLPYNRIVRIEGNLGEQWQNYNFAPDGSPLAQAA